MEKTTLEKFFTAKFFKIPHYQRDYAWISTNVDELFADIAEALETNTSHYIGTFILSRPPGAQFYAVVDGQQRLTTLSMLIHALVEHLPPSDQKSKIIRTDQFLVCDDQPRLELLGHNEAFFRKLLAGEKAEPETRSQRRLRDAYDHIHTRVAALSKEDPAQVKLWLTGVADLQVMEFIEDDDGRAIRIFQTVNDRGKPLSNMEKAKSLLIYYSNRFLAGALDAFVNDRFGAIFRAYDSIKDQAARPGFEIDLLNQSKFTEDSVMRYHFLASPSAYHDYRASTRYVLDDFLKGTLKERQAQGPDALTKFITEYATDLDAFFQELRALVERAGSDAKYYKLLSTLDLSATVYPLFIRLGMRGLLEEEVPNNPGLTFRDLLEIVDLRVYKTRGTNPERDMAHLAAAAPTAAPVSISSRLLGFTKWYMSDAKFREALEDDVTRNQGLHRILVEYEDHARHDAQQLALDVSLLAAMAGNSPAVEHVLAQEPGFKPAARGFADDEEYVWQINRLGNLVLLERAINSRGINKPPEAKAKDANIYQSSSYQTVRELGVQIQGKKVPWRKSDIEARTAVLVDYVLQRWPLWEEPVQEE